MNNQKYSNDAEGLLSLPRQFKASIVVVMLMSGMAKADGVGTPLPAGSSVNTDGNITVPGQGTFHLNTFSVARSFGSYPVATTPLKIASYEETRINKNALHTSSTNLNSGVIANGNNVLAAAHMVADGEGEFRYSSGRYSYNFHDEFYIGTDDAQFIDLKLRFSLQGSWGLPETGGVSFRSRLLIGAAPELGINIGWNDSFLFGVDLSVFPRNSYYSGVVISDFRNRKAGDPGNFSLDPLGLDACSEEWVYGACGVLSNALEENVIEMIVKVPTNRLIGVHFEHTGEVVPQYESSWGGVLATNSGFAIEFNGDDSARIVSESGSHYLKIESPVPEPDRWITLVAGMVLMCRVLLKKPGFNRC